MKFFKKKEEKASINGDYNYTTAKQIFDDYGGSEFHMLRGGDLKKYQKCNVPKEIEDQWKEERIQKLKEEVNSAKTNFYKVIFIQDYANAMYMFYKKEVVDTMEEFKEIIDKFDDYSKYTLIKFVISSLRIMENDKLKSETKKCCLDELKKMQDSSELTIEEKYNEEIEDLPEEYQHQVTLPIFKKEIERAIEFGKEV